MLLDQELMGEIKGHFQELTTEEKAQVLTKLDKPGQNIFLHLLDGYVGPEEHKYDIETLLDEIEYERQQTQEVESDLRNLHDQYLNVSEQVAELERKLKGYEAIYGKERFGKLEL